MNEQIRHIQSFSRSSLTSKFVFTSMIQHVRKQTNIFCLVISLKFLTLGNDRIKEQMKDFKKKNFLII